SNALSVASIDGNTSAIGNAITLTNGSSLTMQADGSFVLTPAAHTAYSDFFTCNISDTVSSANMTVTVTITNNTPTLSGGYFSMSHDRTQANIDILGNASDADGDTLTISITANPSHGTVSQNSSGKWDYTPTAGYTGSDWFGA